jgi:hypothetical protein
MSSPVDTQKIIVDYTNTVLKCCICNESHESNGNIAKFSICNHKFHIGCLLYKLTKENLRCTECNTKFKDVRFSIAMAAKDGSAADLINILADPTNIP